MGRNCKDCGTTDRRATAVRALKLLGLLPDQFTCVRNFSKSTAAFLSAARDFAAECAMAHTWTNEEARIRYDAFRLSDAVSIYLQRGPGGGGLGESAFACDKEMTDCITSCDNDPDSGYTCYFDCRLAYYACLAGSILHFGGGVEEPA
jgi:hypothetical protein